MLSEKEVMNMAMDVLAEIASSGKFNVEFDCNFTEITITPKNVGNAVDVDSSGNECIPMCLIDINGSEIDFSVNFGTKTDVEDAKLTDFISWTYKFLVVCDWEELFQSLI